MNLLGITINHNTASIEQREALHLNQEEIVSFTPMLKENIFSEGFILSTCNRTEIFGIPLHTGVSGEHLINSLLQFKPLESISNNNFLQFFSCSAVKHLFSVTSGIDSLIIGDSQILGQAKESYQLSEDLKFAGTLSKRLFDASIKVGKRAIKETSIGDGAVTVSYAAVQVVEKIFSNLQKKSALIIGAGETGELAAVHLRDKEVGQITIANRTIKKAEALAKKVHGDILPYEDLKNQLHKYDIILSATSAENLILTKDDIKSAMKKRRGTPCCIMDIAIPRDIDPNAQDIDNVFYNDIDSLKVIVDQNMSRRKQEIPVVNKIIMEELVGFFSWYNTLDIVPTIKSVREFFEDIRQDELEKIKHKVTQEDYEKLEDMTRRMIGRILHNPTMKLRNLAESGSDTQEAITHSMIIKELFNINDESKNGSNEK